MGKRARVASPVHGRYTPSRSVLFLLLGGALLVKGLALAQLAGHPLLQPIGQLDSAYYASLARQVADGDLAAGNRVFFVSPLYVYFLASVLAVSRGSLVAALVVQVVLGTLAVALIALTAREWFGAKAASLAATLAALTGQFTFNEVLILQSALDPVLTAGALWLLTRAWLRPSPGSLVGAGFVLGLQVLNRPNALVFAVAAIGVTAIVCGPPRRAGYDGVAGRRWLAACVLAAGFAAAIAPIAVRNYAVAGELSLVSSHGGLNFLIGNGPGATGTYRALPGITPSIAGQATDARHVAETAEGRPLTDTEVSSHFYRQARSWIASHPQDAARVFLRKIAYVMNAADVSLNYSYAYYQRDERTVLRFLVIGPWLLLPLGVFGAFALRPGGTRDGESSRGALVGTARWRAAWWGWVAFVPLYALSVAVFFVSGRYRLPLLVPLCVTSAAALSRAWDLIGAGRARAMAPAAVVVGALAVATNWNLGLDDGRASERTEMILHLIDTHEDARASALLSEAEPMHPEPALLLFRAGQAFLARGDAVRAIPLLRRAAALEPGRAETSLTLGQALLDAGHAGEAVPHLRAAVGAGVSPDVAAFDLARALAATGANAEAVGALRRIARGETLDAPSQYAVGRLALGLGDPALAEWYLARAVAGAPREASIREALALAQARQGRRRDAQATLEAAIGVDPANASLRLNLAVMYAEEGRFADARRLAGDALRLNPDYARALAFLDALPPP